MTRTALFASAAALLLAPVAAHAKGFEPGFKLTAPVKVEVVLSDSLSYRAENLPEDLSDRGGARGFRDGFSGNGFYGEDALQYLVEQTYEELAEDFSKAGLTQSDTATTVLRVTIEDVRNNRPTFRQLSVQPGLSYDSFSSGGAEFTAEIIGPDGQYLGAMEYDYYNSLIDDFRFAQSRSVWSDARRAISRFSRKATKSLS